MPDNRQHLHLPLWLAAQPPRLASLFTQITSDQGTVSVSFILTLPIFLLIMAIIVQLALLMNAKIMVDQAVISVGRSAATCLPTDAQLDSINASDNIHRTAYIQLVPLSPVAQSDSSITAATLTQAFTNSGITLPNDFAQRYTYAEDATTLSYPTNIDYFRTTGQAIELTVSYKFYLSVPGAQLLIGSSDTVGGIKGRFMTLVSTTQVQTTHGRAANTTN